MKKFLSLVLALIMTMSLVTIGASAAEYKDFTDKDEITYAEAVAVLNRLGIITGYSEGDFRPEGELTRGAAAKIIASLLIGPEAANNLSPTTAPFKDVPLDHTFAGPIAYCSTLKIINGYSDGSFQPGGTLTGYAFSKMLLGALGYDGDIEGFVGSGWNMNVMRLGGDAGLFDSISFKGNEPVNREQAAQLALNTLKATLVEYTGALNVTAGDASVTSKPTRTYVISNQEFATHINNKKASQVGNANVTTHYTVEFGEQHFVDLRMTYDRNTYDDFGRPSNEWSYKKVTIGTFPIEPDYVYTEQMEHDVDTVTNATKARALGLTGFEIKSDSGKATTVTVNGLVQKNALTDIGEIADYTDNGTVVEVYVSDDDADWVRDVVVVKTQLMEVKRIGKDYVALDLYDDGSDSKDKKSIGYNQEPIDEKVDNVEVDDAYYTLLSGLKVNDRVAVVPVTVDNGSHYTVAKAYVPETASGKLTNVETYGSSRSDVNAIGVTVGDNAYDIALWNKDLIDIDGQKLDVTTKDVTLTLDEFGNALLAEDVGATSDFMIVGGFYNSLVNGKLVTYVKGWDISGEELSLNLGSKYPTKGSGTGVTEDIMPGDLVYYTNNGVTGDADWRISDDSANGVFDIETGKDPESTASPQADYQIKASNSRILTVQQYYATASGATTAQVLESKKPWIDKSIKFIYVTFADDGDVDFIEIKKGVQAASNDELIKTYENLGGYYNAAQAALAVDSKGNTKSDATVKAVVIKNESNDAVASNMLYVVNYIGGAGKTEDGEIVYKYTVAMNGPDGIIDDDMTIYSTKKLDRGDWARYSEAKDDNFENFYTLKLVDQRHRATSTMEANFLQYAVATVNNKTLLKLDSTKLYAPNGNQLTAGGATNKLDLPDIKDSKIQNLGTGDNDAGYLVNILNAEWVDLTGKGIDSYDDLYNLTQKDKEFALSSVKVSMIFNDDMGKDNFRSVAMIVVMEAGDSNGGGAGVGTTGITVDSAKIVAGGVVAEVTVEAPKFAADGATTNPRVAVISGGKTITSGYASSYVTGAGLEDGYNRIVIPNLGLAENEDFTFVVNPYDEAVVWSDVVVRITGAPELKNTSDALPATLPTGTASFSGIIAKGSTYKSPDSKMTVKDNGTICTGFNNAAVVVDGTNALNAGTFTVTGTGYVDIDFTMVALPKTYTVTAATPLTDGTDAAAVTLGSKGVEGATDAAYKIVLDLSAVPASISESDNFDVRNIKVSLKQADGNTAQTSLTDAISYKVTVGDFGSVVIDATHNANVSVTKGSNASDNLIKLTKSVALGVADITIEVVEPLLALDADDPGTWTNNTIVLNFNHPVTDATTEDAVDTWTTSIASGATIGFGTLSNGGKTLTITFAGGALAADDTLSLPATVKSTVTSTNTTDAKTITLKVTNGENTLDIT